MWSADVRLGLLLAWLGLGSLTSARNPFFDRTEELSISAPAVIVEDDVCQASLQALNSCTVRLAAEAACSEIHIMNNTRVQQALGCRGEGGVGLRECHDKCLMNLSKLGLPLTVDDHNCNVKEQLMKQYSGSLKLVVAFQEDEETGLPTPQMLPTAVADLKGIPSLSFLGEYQRCVYDENMQYCLLEGSVDLGPTPVAGLFGECRPASCSAAAVREDVGKSVSSLLKNVKTTCHHINDPPPPIGWTGGQIFALVVMGCIFLLLVAGSAHFAFAKSDARDMSGGWRGTMSSFFNAWSVQRNLASFVKKRKEDDTVSLAVLDGIRVLSTFWVVLGHTVIWPLLSIGYENTGMILPPTGRLTEVWFQLIPGGYFAVDTFFLLSGLLGARTLGAKVKRNPSLLTMRGFFLKLYPMSLLSRWLRLTLVYAFILMFSTTWFRELGRGSLLWDANTGMAMGAGCLSSIDSPDCSKYLWAQLLYVNNAVNSACMGWTWYLACDMQMFLTLPLLVLIRERFGKVFGWAVVALGTVGSMVACYLQIFAGKMVSDPILGNMSRDGKYLTEVYEVSWMRVQPYLIGIGCAWLLEYFLELRQARDEPDQNSFEQEQRATAGIEPLPLLAEASRPRLRDQRTMKMAAWVVGALLLQVVGFALMASVVFLPVQRYRCKDFLSCCNVDTSPWSPEANALYGAINHSVWGVGLGIFLLLCFFRAPGSGWANWILGGEFWQPMVKLSYSAYLLHPLVLVFFYCQSNSSLPYVDALMTSNFIAFVTVVFCFAFLVWLCVEKPGANLSAQFMGALAGKGGDRSEA